MSKHSLGPWSAGTYCHGDDIYIKDANGEWIGKACPFFSSDAHAKQWANAHLIAAAADMLETLQKIDSYYSDFAKYPSVPVAELRTLIRATLEKAIGSGAKGEVA